MSEYFTHKSNECRCYFRIGVLVALWIFALIAGIYIASISGSTFLPALCAAVKISPSLVGLVAVTLLPVAVCAIGEVANLFAIDCVVIAFSGLFRGYFGFLLYILYGSGAWLLRSLFLFSSTAIDVLLLWMVLRNCVYRRADFRRTFPGIAVIVFLLIVVERFIVSPLLIRLSMCL